MITSPKMSRLFLNLILSRRLQQRCLLCTSIRKYAKKKSYNYNLDDLIDWKNKTDLIFGSARKITKTGKLRKSKNDNNEKLLETMEVLSAQSTHLKSNIVGLDKETSFVYDREETDLNPPKEVTSDVNTQQFVQIPDFLDAHPSEEFFEHGVPSPVTKSGSMPEDLQDYSSTEFFKKEVNTTNNSQKMPYVKRIQDVSNDSIYIPVISPIPTGDFNKPNVYNDNVEFRTNTSEKKQFNPKQIPTEPPDSFNFINNVPLHFNSKEIEEENSAYEKMMLFKEDIKSLSLRTVPSVKSILNKTMPDLNRFFLNRWREKMIAELGEEGFKVHQEATINRGINFHANVMELLSGKPESEIQIMPDNQGHWASLQTAMKHITDIHTLETDMRHPALLYRGVADCVAKYKDVLCVIDWKTSKKPRPLLKNTYNDPLQVAAYIGLVNANKALLKVGEVNHGLLVIIYPDGNPAHIHLMNKSLCEQYWQDWLGRLYYFYQLVYTEKFGAR